MMKVSIPRIKTIRPKKFAQSAIRQHLSEHVLNGADHMKSPMSAYAFVAFREDGSFYAVWHGSPYLNAIDIPDAVKVRLKHAMDTSNCKIQ